MPLCIIGKSSVFSDSYNNFFLRGYDVDALVPRVRELLHNARPELIWFPETSQIGVVHTSLRAARAETPVEDIEHLMETFWSLAAREQFETMTPGQKHFVALVDSAQDINEVLRLQRGKEAIINEKKKWKGG